VTPRLVSQRTWADELGISVWTFRRWLAAGRIPEPLDLDGWSRSARFQQSQGALHGAHVSGEGVGEFHAGEVTEGGGRALINSIEQVTR
jgi:hypothetical protein